MSTYVCSDVHGSYDLFKRMLKIISFSRSDIMYILGDVIDKGPEPMKMIDYCMNNSNIILLMGNHELMMYRAYTKVGMEHLWFNNGGLYTGKQYEALPDKQQDDIFMYIKSLPLIIRNVSVNNRTFYLSHATYYPYTLPCNKDIFTLQDIGKYVEPLVWERNYPFYNLKFSDAFLDNKNSILIAGHTAGIKLYQQKTGTKYQGKTFIFHDMKGHYINVDCGLAYRYSMRTYNFTPRLGCLRLDDMKEFYT